MDKHKIEAGVRLLLEGIGVDAGDHNFADTPKRVAKFYAEMFKPVSNGDWPVFQENYNDIIIMRGVKFTTLCPHHLLPVKISANIAYLPKNNVLGASKLIRLCHAVNTQPFTQEKLTDLIAERLRAEAVGNLGVGVVLYGEHDCMRIRGVHSDATMVTSTFYGKFERDTHLQWQVLNIPK